ncbi:anti-sigma factor antagonist [candidate division KSB1 bacterium]|nr:anti-sigma factor antagonist [candidate division KSB1 bacterium]
MEIESNVKNSIAIIALSSKILGSPEDTKLFENRVTTLMDQGINKVILDLSQVKRINSTGLAILITGFNLLANSGGQFVLAQLNDFIKGALTITKLDNVLTYYDTIEEAENK